MSKTESEKKTELSDERRHAISATLKAMSAVSPDKEIRVIFGGNREGVVNTESRTVLLPSVLAGGEEKGLRMVRGKADAAALRLRYHDSAVFYRHRPESSEAAEIFDMLEQARVESLGARDMQGVAHNLEERLAARCREKGFNVLTQPVDPPTADLLALALRERVTGRKPPRAARELMKVWRDWVERKAGKALDAMALQVENQEDFSRSVCKMLESMGMAQGAESAESSQDDGAEEPQQEGEDDQTQADGDEEASELPDMEGASGEEEQSDEQMPASQSRPDMVKEQIVEDASFTPEWQLPNFPELYTDYRVYTTHFDEVVAAESLAESDELVQLRAQLDAKLAQVGNVTGKLANRLQRLLMARQQRHWHFDREEGVIDSSKLARLVTNPGYSAIYKEESDTTFRDTVVTLLLDNSGSMRGRPITVAALSADILTRTLERCGVKVEILGFTTREWRGGGSRKAWMKAGSSPNPGRLNDLRHIVYKSAEMPWRRARRNLGLMLKEGILKENIDGEALIWAWQRLIQRPEQRRILMVISDGAPVDDSTLSANNASLLDAHLRRVIGYIQDMAEQMVNPVELLAIGIGHDVARYYKRAVMISEVEKLADTMASELTWLFTKDER